MYELNNFDSIQIGIASPEKIREWSYGEVTKPETINYRTTKPEKDGLFCEKIFGPTKDWECHCGKYKRIRYKGVICDKCGVEVTRAKVRRERMGHIELAAPVSHIWYFRGVPSRMGLLLDMSPKLLEQVLNFASFVVLDPMATSLAKKQVLTPNEHREAVETYGAANFKVGMGAESIKELLMEVDLEKEAEQLRKTLEKATGQKRIRAIKRLEIVESFRRSGNKPYFQLHIFPKFFLQHPFCLPFPGNIRQSAPQVPPRKDLRRISEHSTESAQVPAHSRRFCLMIYAQNIFSNPHAEDPGSIQKELRYHRLPSNISAIRPKPAERPSSPAHSSIRF